MPSWQLTTRSPMLRKGRFSQRRCKAARLGSDGRRRTAAMQIQQMQNGPVSPRDQALASRARLRSSACRGQLGPLHWRSFLIFDRLLNRRALLARQRADLNRSQYKSLINLRSIDAGARNLAHRAGIKLRVAHLRHGVGVLSRRLIGRRFGADRSDTTHFTCCVIASFTRYQRGQCHVSR
jgi:hypothetical protein